MQQEMILVTFEAAGKAFSSFRLQRQLQLNSEQRTWNMGQQTEGRANPESGGTRNREKKAESERREVEDRKQAGSERVTHLWIQHLLSFL